MEASNIYECLTPIIKASLLLGLLPIQLSTNKVVIKAQFSNLAVLIPATYLGVTTVLLYEEISAPIKHQSSKYGIGVLYIGAVFIFTANTIALYVIFISNTITGKAVAQVINKISKADGSMKVLVNKVDHRSHFKYELRVITTGLLILVVEIILHYCSLNSKQKLLHGRKLFLLTFPVIVRMMLEFQYVMFIKLLHERFVVLNKELYGLLRQGSAACCKQISTIPLPTTGWITKEPKYIDTQLRYIEMLMDLHDTLSDIGKLINKLFSLQVLACLATHLTNEIFMVFYTYFEMVHHHYIPALHWIGWIITINLEILLVTSVCHQTTSEASGTASVINKLFLDVEFNKVIKDKLFIFSQQIQHAALKFSACSLFPIDARLIFMVTCASSTYLLIMFQYQEGIEIQCYYKNSTM